MQKSFFIWDLIPLFHYLTAGLNTSLNIPKPVTQYIHYITILRNGVKMQCLNRFCGMLEAARMNELSLKFARPLRVYC